MNAYAAMDVMTELGSMYLLVDGHCGFFAWNKDRQMNPDGLWSAAREGVLDEGTEAELATAFAYDSWPDQVGVHGPDHPGFSDTPRLLLFDGETRVECRKPCDVSAPELNTALENLNDWIGRIYAQGHDLAGPIRFEENELPSRVPLQPTVAWPLSEAPETLVGIHKIDGVEDGRRLRQLRAELGARTSPTIPALVDRPDSDGQYEFCFRDILPFEDENGRIPGLAGDP